MDHTSESTLDPPKSVDFAFDRMEELVSMTQKFYQWISKVLKIKEFQASAKILMNDHPVLSVFIGVAMTLCAVPVFCFFVFAVTTAALLFMGFLLAEGAVIAFGFVILVGTLFCIIFLSLGCSLFILAVYYSTVFIRQLSANLKQRLMPQNSGCHAE